MAEESAEKKTVKKVKRALETPPEPPKEEPLRPTPSEVRAAKKAQLVTWCETLGLDAEGKVDELRGRLLEFIERAEEPTPAKEPKGEAKPAPGKPAPKEKPGKARKGAKEEPEKEKPVPFVARAKPKLDPRLRSLLRLRAEVSARRPVFHRQEWFRYGRLEAVWRKPQGGQSKLRRHFGYRWNLPSIGYRGPRAVRGLHPSGFEEVLVHNLRELEGIDPARQAVRIAHGVGTRKRELIEAACDEREIRVLNRMVTE